MYVKPYQFYSILSHSNQPYSIIFCLNSNESYSSVVNLHSNYPYSTRFYLHSNHAYSVLLNLDSKHLYYYTWFYLRSNQQYYIILNLHSNQPYSTGLCLHSTHYVLRYSIFLLLSPTYWEAGLHKWVFGCSVDTLGCHHKARTWRIPRTSSHRVSLQWIDRNSLHC